jgi:hypothetical protein
MSEADKCLAARYLMRPRRVGVDSLRHTLGQLEAQSTDIGMSSALGGNVEEHTERERAAWGDVLALRPVAAHVAP